MVTETLEELMAGAFKQDRDMQYSKYEFKNHQIQVLQGEMGSLYDGFCTKIENFENSSVGMLHNSASKFMSVSQQKFTKFTQ